MNTEKIASKYYAKLTVFNNDHRCLRKESNNFNKRDLGATLSAMSFAFLHETHFVRVTLNKIHISKISVCGLLCT